MQLVDGESGQIIIEDGVFGSNRVTVIAPSEVGGFLMTKWHCRDYLALHLNRVSGSANPSGMRGIHIRSSRIDRFVSLWPGAELTRRFQSKLDAEAAFPRFILLRDGRIDEADSPENLGRYLNRWQRRLTVFGAVSIRGCKIGEFVNLTGVDVDNPWNAGEGDIRLVDSEVGGHVIFGSPQSYLAAPRLDDLVLRCLARFMIVQPPADADQPKLAHCDGVDMSRSSAAEVDLSGLRVRPRQAGAERSPGVNLHYMKVRGRLATFARLDEQKLNDAFDEIDEILPTPPPQSQVRRAITVDPLPNLPDARRSLLVACFGKQRIEELEQTADRGRRVHSSPVFAQIPGALNLRHAEIDELVVSDQSFTTKHPRAKAADEGIVLDDARISRLSVSRGEIKQIESRWHNGFPVPLSLLHTSVAAWILDDTSETATADPYLDLLDNDPDFRMSSYLAIERSLQDRGLEDEARRVYIAGRYRDARSPEPATAIRHLPHTWVWGRWRPGDGRLRAKRLFFRLRRPASEYFAFWICSLWILLTAFTLVMLVTATTAHPDSQERIGLIKASLIGLRDGHILLSVAVFGAILAILFGLVLVQKTFKIFIDHLHWSLIDYGTSFARLAWLIVGLAAISFFFVSGQRTNFEPTLAAESMDAQQQAASAAANDKGVPIPQKYRKWEVNPRWDTEFGHWVLPESPKPDQWPFGERLWMTLRYHVPLAGAIISEEWQPADEPLRIAFLNSRPETPHWWPFAHWLRARDWFGFMLWVNWALWPLFLPYVIRRITRDR